MNTRIPSFADKRLELLLPLLLLAIFALCAGYFAQVQSIWVDETTQISGLSLESRQQLAWLMGRGEVSLGVPADRMPPLSYLIGSLWIKIFGLSEISLRWLGITAVATAAPALYAAGRRAAGAAGGVFCLGFILLGPNVLVQAVEIRSYPIFLSFCAWGTWCFAVLTLPHLDDALPSWKALLGLTVCVLAATYTHYYGLVFGAFVFGALLVDQWRRRAAPGRILAAGVATAVLGLGVLPFILAATDMSAPGTAATQATDLSSRISTRLIDTARLAIRLVAHGSHFTYIAIAAVLAGAVGILTVLSLSASRADIPWQSRWIVFVPLIIAFPVLAALSIAINGFDVLAPHYNLWMMPILALGMSFALQAKANWQRKLALGAACLAVMGQLAGTAVLIRNGTYFTHGPGEWVARAITEPTQTLIVHDTDGAWGHVYFPVYLLTEGKATQVLIDSDGQVRKITPTGLVDIQLNSDTVATEFDTVLHVSAKHRNTAFLNARIRKNQSCDGGQAPTLFLKDLSAQPETYCAFVSATLIRSP